MDSCSECLFRDEQHSGGHGMGDIVLYSCRLGFNFINKSWSDKCSPNLCPLHPFKYSKNKIIEMLSK